MSRCRECGDRCAGSMCTTCADTTTLTPPSVAAYPVPDRPRQASGAVTRIGVLEIYDTGSHVLPWGVRRVGERYPILQSQERAIALAFARDHASEYGRV